MSKKRKKVFQNTTKSSSLSQGKSFFKKPTQ